MDSLMDLYGFATDLFSMLRDTFGRLVDWLTTPLISSESGGVVAKVWSALVSFADLLGINIPTEIVPIYLIFGGGIIIILSVGLISFFTNVIS